MEVTETLNEGLKREFKVVVAAAQLEQQMMARLSELGATANIRGFRKGKVPITHLRKLYGKSVMAEVVQKTVEETSQQALVEKEVKPAYQPEIGMTEDEEEITSIIDGKADLAYTMSFEVVPPIDIDDFGKLDVLRHTVKVEDEHIVSALESIATQYKDFEPRKDGGKAEDGDRVTISFVGRIDGEAFDGGTAEDVPLELGSNSFIPGFEEQLVGAKAGDEKIVKVSFPEDYGVDTLAGKPAEFETRISAVEAPKASEINDEFAQKLGLEGLDKLRESVSERISEEFTEMSKLKLKRDMLDALDGAYSFELPAKLVEAEFNQIWAALTAEMEKESRSFEDEDTTEDEARAEYSKIAERRVRLGLVLGTIGEQAEVTVNEDELERALMERARQFPGQEKMVYDFYRKNPNAMVELRGPIFEQKVVDHIAEKASIGEKPVTRDELVHLLEHEDHDHDHDHGDETKAKKAKNAKPAKKAAAAKKPAAKKAAAKKKPAKK
ncbi:MAG: trigger factor [Hyphomicrobiales bacterium]|nr:trigger factor [Hyphomicrobiales bacterium]